MLYITPMEDFIRKLEEKKSFGDTFTIYVGRHKMEWDVQIAEIDKEKGIAVFKTAVGRQVLRFTQFDF
jgi:hypothetical protein